MAAVKGDTWAEQLRTAAEQLKTEAKQLKDQARPWSSSRMDLVKDVVQLSPGLDSEPGPAAGPGPHSSLLDHNFAF